MIFYDAHNHLQDERLDGVRDEVLSRAASWGIGAMVVNGAAESDWESVCTLALRHRHLIPSFGYHPWYVDEASADWKAHLESYLDRVPSAIGEIGLDRFQEKFNTELQERLFLEQLKIAIERELPVSIHCLRAWGRLVELLTTSPRLPRGFVLHSYGGSPELVPVLAKLGGYFSFAGYFLRAEKRTKQEAFRVVPRERLLVETDAPDQALPPEHEMFPLPSSDGKSRLNHPLNLIAVYEGLAAVLGAKREELAEQVEANFLTVFGALLRTSHSE